MKTKTAGDVNFADERAHWAASTLYPDVELNYMNSRRALYIAKDVGDVRHDVEGDVSCGFGAIDICGRRRRR